MSRWSKPSPTRARESSRRSRKFPAWCSLNSATDNSSNCFHPDAGAGLAGEGRFLPADLQLQNSVKGFSKKHQLAAGFQREICQRFQEIFLLLVQLGNSRHAQAP